MSARHVSRWGAQQRARPALGSAALLVCAVLAGPAASTPQNAAAARTYVVKIEGLRFNPPTLTVTQGDRIVWMNNDLFPHTVTADGKKYDSRDIQPGASWTYVTRSPGDYPYACTYHPTMKGRLIVESKRAQAPGA
jgi:plastocyanin